MMVEGLKIAGALRILYPNLKDHEISILKYLISCGESQGAMRISVNTKIRRTKSYTYINNLIAAGLIKPVEVEIPPRPEVWEWWSDIRRKRWATEQKLNVVQWIPCVDVILYKIDSFYNDINLILWLNQKLTREVEA